MRMEVGGHDCDCSHSAGAGGDLGHREGTAVVLCLLGAWRMLIMVSALFIATEH